MKKLVLFFVFFILLNINEVNASTIYKRDYKSDRTEITSESIEYKFADMAMKIVDTEVVLEEDDNNYIFNVEQNIINDNLKKDYTYHGIRPEVALTSFDSITNSSFVGISENKIYSNGYTSKYDNIFRIGVVGSARYYEYDENLNDKPYHEEDKYCKQTFYLTDLFGFYLVTKKNMDSSKHNLKIDKKYTYSLKVSNDDSYKYKYKELSMNLKYKITIAKNNIDDYRYLSTYVPEAFKKDDTELVPSETFTMYNLCTPSIDLKQYADAHTHDFKIKNVYKDYHELYCEGCKWTKKIEHEYVDTYDGIEENLCICGKHKYVNIHIENNIDDDVYVDKLEVYDDFPFYEMNKVGKHLIKLKTVSKNFNKDSDITEDFSGIEEETYEYENELVFPEKVPNTSTSYYLYYDINKYNVVFNKKNNLDLVIENNIYMNNMSYEIDENKKLVKNKYIIEGYDFLGWCDDETILKDENIEDIDKVKYLDEEELLNVTYENEKVINLYPIYKIIKFTITYKNNIYGNVLKKIVCDVNTKEEFPKYTEFGIKAKDYSFSGYYINDKSVSNTTSGLIKYVKSDGKGNGSNIDVVASFASRSSSDDYDGGPEINDGASGNGGNGGGSGGNGDGNGGGNGNGGGHSNENDTNSDIEDKNKDNNETNNNETNNNETKTNNDLNDTENSNKNKDDKDKNDNKNDNENEDNKDNKKSIFDNDDDLDNDNNDGQGDSSNLDDLEDKLNNTKDNNTIIDKIISVIKDVFDNIIKGLINIKDIIVNFIKSVLGENTAVISKMLNDIKDFIKNIISSILPFIKNAIEVLKGVFSSFSGFISSLYDKILAFFSNFSSSFMIFISVVSASLISLYYLVIFIIYIVEKKRKSIERKT